MEVSGQLYSTAASPPVEIATATPWIEGSSDGDMSVSFASCNNKFVDWTFYLLIPQFRSPSMIKENR